MSYESCFERLTLYFSSVKYRGELVGAKENFFGEAGVDGTENQEFEQKHNLFYDWYLLTRPLEGTLLTPSQMALDLDGFEISEEERPYFEALSKARYSIFEFLKTKDKDHYVKNLFTGQKTVVKNSTVTIVAEKGAIFNTHLIFDGKDNAFSQSMVFHPAEVRRFILDQVKKLKKSTHEEQAELAMRLTKMYFKHEKYPHVGFEKIYNLDNPMRF